MKYQVQQRLTSSDQSWASPWSIRVWELMRLTKKCGKCTETPFRSHVNLFASNEQPGCGQMEGGEPGTHGSSFQNRRRFEWRMLYCSVSHCTKEVKFLCKGRGWCLLSTETSVYSRMETHQEETAEQVRETKAESRRCWPRWALPAWGAPALAPWFGNAPAPCKMRAVGHPSAPDQLHSRQKKIKMKNKQLELHPEITMKQM